MKILSLNLGTPKPLDVGDKIVPSAIDRNPVMGPVMLRQSGFDGDACASKMHGAPDGAVYAYSFTHYDYWAQELNRDDFSYGQFGENFTVEDMLEDDMFIGDEYRIGNATVMITGPRGPCYKLAAWFNQDRKSFVQRFLDSGRLGFYMRVLEEGTVEAGDTFEKQQAHPMGLSITALTRLRYDKTLDREATEQALQNIGLAEEDRKALTSRLKRAAS